jgi:hypothetical protein
MRLSARMSMLLLISGAVADVLSNLLDPPAASWSTRHLQRDYPMFLDCPTECSDGEFCGHDLKCHRYSCENWYTLAPENFTGYDPKMSTALECSTVASGEDEDTSFLNIKPYCQGGDMPIAVYHLTDECLGGLVCPHSSYGGVIKNAFVQMNRKCTARPSPKTAFVCYDISPETDSETYFADYVEATTGQENTVPCGGANTTDRNSNFYTGIFKAPRYTVFAGPDSSEAFDTSSVQAAMIGSYAEVEESEFPFCDPGCKDTEFCGRDLKCYEFNCDNFYLQGPTAYTGKGSDGEDAAETLKCFDTPNPSDGLCGETGDDPAPVFPLALKYECLPQNVYYTIDDDCPSPRFQGRFVSYNRYCTAEPNPDQVFTCYDISPETDTQTYFEDYINNVQSNPNCTEENLRYPPDAYDSSTNKAVELVGVHQYRTCLQNVTNGDCSVFDGYDSSLDTFDIDRARFVMSATLSGERRDQSRDNSGVTKKYRARNVLWPIYILSLLFWQ